MYVNTRAVIFTVFMYIHPLQIDKDLHKHRKVSLFPMCSFICDFDPETTFTFSVRVNPFYPYFCITCILILSFIMKTKMDSTFWR